MYDVNTRSKRIAVVDDHALVLAGLTQLIGTIDSNFTTVAFQDGFSLLQNIEEGISFDLIITDLGMEKMNGLMLVEVLRGKGLSTPVIIVSGVDNALSDSETFSAGANRFVHKGDDFEELSQAIHELMGLRPARKAPAPAPAMHINLAPRQIEIVRLVSTGASNKDISAELEISENTVKTHLKKIFQTLEVNNRVECVQKASALGFVNIH